jgi:hypothetical protein
VEVKKEDQLAANVCGIQDRTGRLARWREELKKLSYARFVVFNLAQDKTHKYAPFARMSDNSYPGRQTLSDPPVPSHFLLSSTSLLCFPNSSPPREFHI